MCFSAAMRRPLRSKRAMISPVRLRANASGLTRMRVRSMNFLSIRFRAAVAAGGDLRTTLARGRRWLGHDGLFGGAAATAAARGGRRDGAGLGLAVGAQLPRRVDRLAARVAALLEAAHAARAAEVVALDLVVAVRAELVVEGRQARLGGLHLELAQPHVVEELGRADDHVDDRPYEREHRGEGRAADQHRIVDAAPGIAERPED